MIIALAVFIETMACHFVNLVSEYRRRLPGYLCYQDKPDECSLKGSLILLTCPFQLI